MPLVNKWALLDFGDTYQVGQLTELVTEGVYLLQLFYPDNDNRPPCGVVLNMHAPEGDLFLFDTRDDLLAWVGMYYQDDEVEVVKRKTH